MPYNVYVSAMGADRITRFEMDAETGALSPQEPVPVEGGPAGIAVSPDRRFMHVARRKVCKLSSFAIDPGDGGLAEIGAIPLPSDPCFLSMDNTGRFLLASYYLHEHAAVHRIDANGAAMDPPVVHRHTGQGAHSIRTDPSNRFILVPHVHGRPPGMNAIFQFRFDAESGEIEPNEPDRFQFPAMHGPRHIRFHPSLDVVYACNEQSSDISVLAFDPDKGTLSHIETVPNLPPDWTEHSRCSQIHITPDGRFLYAPNRGHNSIASFAVDAETGRLTPIGHTPSEPIPRAMALDPQARFLLSVGIDSGVLMVCRIDPDTGFPEPIARHDVGAEPMWVTVLPAG
jgi:6-phosphogluconolactonase